MKAKRVFVLSAFIALVLSGCSLLPQLPGQNQRSSNHSVEDYSEEYSIPSSNQRTSSTMSSSSSSASNSSSKNNYSSSSNQTPSSNYNSSSNNGRSSSKRSSSSSSRPIPSSSSYSSSSSEESSNSPSSSQETKPKTVPTVGTADYNVDYLTYDDDGYVTGLSYLPDDGVLFIDAPIRANAFRDVSGFTTTFLGPNCSFIGEQAFYWCENLKYVIIDNSEFPELVYDTWSCTWSWEGFGVYVRDEMFEDLFYLQTNDRLWNTEHRNEIKKLSTLPNNLLKCLGINAFADNDSIRYSINFYDPDHAIEYFDVGLIYNNEFIDVKDNLSSGTFTDLNPNAEYSIRVRYQYNLGNGYGDGTNEAYYSVHTKAIAEPRIAIADYSNAPRDYLTFDEDGYVTGLSYVPDDGMLFIDAPIKERAFYFVIGVTVVILGPNCTYIGDQAFYYSGSLRTVIIDNNAFPELVNDTWGVEWSERNFYVYVYDGIYNHVSSLDTADTNWNEGPRQNCLRRISDLPDYLKQYVGFNITSSVDEVAYSLYFTDPDNVVCDLMVYLLPGMGSNTGVGGSWGGLSSNTEYMVEVRYGYDLYDGRGIVYKTISKTIKTKPEVAP